ncbi:DUF4355 domain-containing protein [Massilioclostridium coli]|uniref:DUF4355 domain-containing protein n=1 Tax=Massilioclostridium coli TaxID=1870991 RepID=UPI0009F307CC|nr:DUF4355 domain-containing protein [Massilioclostridium coli]
MLNKFYLQLFAEDEAAGADGNSSGTEAEASNTEETQSNNLTTFDDFLKDSDNQAEFDRRVQKAIKTAVSNAEKKWKATTDDQLSEAEKLAQMTREEKAEYRAKKLEKELNELKRQNAVSDMAKTARKMLADEEINAPDEIIMNLVSEDAEQTKAAVEAFTKNFKAAVQAAVKDALKGNVPRTGTSSNNGITKDQIMQVKNPAERQKLIAQHIDLFQ